MRKAYLTINCLNLGWVKPVNGFGHTPGNRFPGLLGVAQILDDILPFDWVAKNDQRPAEKTSRTDEPAPPVTFAGLAAEQLLDTADKNRHDQWLRRRGIGQDIADPAAYRVTRLRSQWGIRAPSAGKNVGVGSR